MTRRIVGSLLVLALGLVGSMGTALADDDREVHRSGHGTLGSPWKLELQDEGARIEVDFEVRTPDSHQAWTVVLKDDGNVFFRDTRTTEADGELDVERNVADHAGSDRIVARAVSKVTGEVCRGAVSI